MFDVKLFAAAIKAALVAAAGGEAMAQHVVNLDTSFSGLETHLAATDAAVAALTAQVRAICGEVADDEAALNSVGDALKDDTGGATQAAASGGLPDGVSKGPPDPNLAVVVTPDQVPDGHAVNGDGIVVDPTGAPTGQILTTTDHDLPIGEIAPEHADADPALTVPAEVIGQGFGVTENGSTVVDSQGVPTGEATDPTHPDAASVPVIPLAPTVPADPDPTAAQQP